MAADSKKIILSADGASATVTNATLTDIFTTAVSMDSAVTGVYGLLQKGAIGLGGAMFSNYRHTGKALNFGGRAAY